MTSPAHPLPRRLVLAASGTAVLAAAAACSSGTTASGTTSSAASSAPASSKASSAPPSSSRVTTSAAPSTTSAPASSAEPATTTAVATEQAPTGTPLASVADVQSAGSVVVQAESGPVLLAYTDGTVVAHTAICTHQQCTIAASGSCPCHGSKFNVTTGAVENGPALRPLAEEQVTVSGGQVYPA